MADDFAPGVNVGNPAGFVAGAVGEGTNATAALNAFREAGGEMRTETWYRLYGEVTDSLGRQSQAAQLNPYSIPDADAYSTWEMGAGGKFATQVQVFFRDQDTGIIGSSNYTYITDQAHAPGEAEAAAFDEYADPDNASNYAQSMLGTMTTNVYATVPYGG
jgi:hypothetical protein